MMALFGLTLVLTFVPVFPGAGTTPRWMLLSLLIPLVFIFKDIPWRPAFSAGLAFLGYAALSLLWTPVIAEGVGAWWQLVLLGGAFAIGASLPSLRGLFIGLALGFALNSAVVMAQVYGWEGLPQTYVPGGLFMNKNVGGEAAALIFIGLLGYRLWWLIPLPLITLVLSGAKGGILAAALGVLMFGGMRGAFVLLAAAGAAVVYPEWAGHVAHVGQRVDVWRDMLENLTPFGHGIGSFYTLAPTIAHHNQLGVGFDYAHNDWLQLVFELGIGVIPLAALAILAIAGTGCRVSKAVMLAFLVEGCFGFPLHMPVTGVVALCCAGHFFGARFDLRRHGGFREPLLRGGDARIRSVVGA